ncbi:septum site-determining protein Ssd [Streptomonospora wellingtoniae]|uniref:Histidine kinase n=1 Tax=Streptomonospora wellingtoniae TaxID=3075544 RepID=A0ABU2KXK7_9ACTN|nr:septum site-determining protein Ssd [Streptomonospora sp. DSM 45055]MDT0304036.1 histidine kinase [Streptomonospora sp. DSM 45055]
MDPSAPARPLLVTEDPRLLDDLLRLAAAAGVEATVAHHAAQAVPEWDRAPLVVVGADLLPALARLAPEPRRHVLVAGLGDSVHGAEAWEAALRVGAGAVLSLPADESRLAGLLTDSAHARAGRAPVVAVVGGRGGAGASLLAIALALSARRAGLQSALVDADPLGGGLDALLGREEAPGDRWGDLVARQGRLNWSALRSRLPDVCGAALVTWGQGPAAPVPPTAMRAVLDCAVRGADLVVADLPRAPDPAADEALRRASVVLLVTPAEVPAVFAAARAVPRLRRTAGDVRLVVRKGSSAVTAPDVARTLGLPVAGRLRLERGLTRRLRNGTVPADTRSSPLAECADRLLAGLLPPRPVDQAGSPRPPAPAHRSRPPPQPVGLAARWAVRRGRVPAERRRSTHSARRSGRSDRRTGDCPNGRAFA